MMNKSYQELAGRTECDQRASLCRMMYGYNTAPAVFTGVIANDSPQLIPVRVNHAIIGLCGEIGEISELLDAGNSDPAQMILEIGDALWYIAEGCNALEFDMGYMVRTCRHWASIQTPRRLSVLGGKLCSELQRWVYYGKYDTTMPQLKMSLFRLYQDVIVSLQYLVPNGHDLEMIQTANIEKLNKRYPEKYSDWHAADENRDRLKEESHVVAQNKAFGEQYGERPQ